jgi:methionyl-tRNA formyltransferase
MKKVLVVADNTTMLGKFGGIAEELGLSGQMDYRRTGAGDENRPPDLPALDLRSDCDWIIANYRLVFSLHCRQIFPPRLVNSITCVNVHPGFIPENRGWYPQVFSIKNRRPLGATIHLMTEEIDFGGIIDRKEVPVYDWDTSETAYSRVLEAECGLLREWLPRILAGAFNTIIPAEKGNLKFRKDFEELCRLRPDQVATYRQVIDHLRALSHGGHRNAYFYAEGGEKVYVTIQLYRE